MKKIYYQLLMIVGALAISSSNSTQIVHLHDRDYTLYYPVESSTMGISESYSTIIFKFMDWFPNLTHEVLEIDLPFNDKFGLMSWLGVEPITKASFVNKPDYLIPEDIEFLGIAPLSHDNNWSTFSCTFCHADTLFGHHVIGVGNKNVRAATFIGAAKEQIADDTYTFFSVAADVLSFSSQMGDFRDRLDRIHAPKATYPGLDTSLALVASTIQGKEISAIGESKPMPWWTLKYKDRWLSDGSLTSGNPLITNILWNEIGRGSELTDVQSWLARNSNLLDTLFSQINDTISPKWTQIFPESSLNKDLAQTGQNIYASLCESCHGTYSIDWSSDTKIDLSYDTSVVDVGTDSSRWRLMLEVAPIINSLDVSKATSTVLVPQKGYVPPPLDGIFLRYPYFHNNSVPNLCALLSPPKSRPTIYPVFKTVDAERDFDADCVGYPNQYQTLSDVVYWFDTRKEGLSNRGHWEMLNLPNGQLSEQEKLALIEFMKFL